MPGWSVVVPVKRIEVAKTRLRAALPTADHERLVMAICLDTVIGALGCPAVARVVVITDDPEAGPALADLGALVARDEPGRGLNPALEYGAGLAAREAPADPVAALSADLPALRSIELAGALGAASNYRRAFVADAAATGTTLLAVSAGEPLNAAYGAGSRAAHTASGAVELAGAWPSLRRDVDTAADLTAAVALGLGRHTAALIG